MMTTAEAGANQQVNITDNVKLDFSGLFSDDLEAPERPAERQDPIEQTGSIEREQAVQLSIQAARAKEDHERNIEMYGTYQRNIKASSQLQTEILKGLKAGEDVYTLFLKAAKAISLMTSTDLFYTQTEEDLKAIYGVGLQEKPPLQIELDSVQKRLQKLREAEKRENDSDSKNRIRGAIKAHEARATELQAMIDK